MEKLRVALRGAASDYIEPFDDSSILIKTNYFNYQAFATRTIF